MRSRLRCCKLGITKEMVGLLNLAFLVAGMSCHAAGSPTRALPVRKQSNSGVSVSYKRVLAQISGSVFSSRASVTPLAT